jgi:hypothetical protein
MVRRSNKSVAEILSPTNVSELDCNNDKVLALLEGKISLATEGFTTHKFCELILRDRNRLSKENALTICDYVDGTGPSPYLPNLHLLRTLEPRLLHSFQ